MARGSRSQRRAKHIIERSGGARIRRGTSDRLEVGSDGLFARTDGARELRVGGTLSERVGGDHTTRAKRVEQTVRGGARISGSTDTILLGGAMSDVHAGAELVLAGMSDDLVIGAGLRVTAPLDLWLVGLVGLEYKVATATFDGAIVDTARTLFEREYATGVHNAGSASFSGAVYATQATGFRKLMKVSSGVRNLSSGGGGGSGDSESSSPGPSTAATSPDSAPEPGLLGSTRTPRPGSAGSDSTDLARLAGEASSTEDASLYRRTEDVSETTADLQEAARTQVAGDSPDEAVHAPSRTESAEGPSTATTSPSGNDASPPDIHPDVSTPDQGTAPAAQPDWTPPPRKEHTYTLGQAHIGSTFEEFDFNEVVRQRPDKLLSDDAQDVWDAAAFRIVYDAKDDVTEMARNTVRLADPEIKPGTVSDMSAIEARDYLLALHNGAIQTGDSEEARRLQDLLNDLDHYAFDRYSAGLAEAEAAHDMTPLKLPSTVDADALRQRLTELANEQFARIGDPDLTDAERHEVNKLGTAYTMAAQDAEQGLHPLASIQAIIDSDLNHADSQIYAQAASEISALISPVAPAVVPHRAIRSLWARAGDIASTLLSFVRLDSRPGSSLSHADDISAVDTPIRFLDSSTDVRPPDPAPSREVRLSGAGRGPERTPRETGPTTAGHAGVDPAVQPRAPHAPPEAPPGLHPTLDRNGAYWSAPASTTEDSLTRPWPDSPEATDGESSIPR